MSICNYREPNIIYELSLDIIWSLRAEDGNSSYRCVVGSFADGDLSTYVVELQDDLNENGILYDMERSEPTNLKRSETAGIPQKCLGLFSSALSGIMMFYNDESFGLLQVTNLQQDMNQEQESFHPVLSPWWTKNNKMIGHSMMLKNIYGNYLSKKKVVETVNLE